MREGEVAVAVAVSGIGALEDASEAIVGPNQAAYAPQLHFATIRYH